MLNIKAINGAMVKVYNLTGQLQKQEALQAGYVSIADLDNGIYFVNVNNQISRVVKK